MIATKKFSLVTFFGLALMLAFAGSAFAQGTGTITGTVTDTLTGDTLPGANISVEDTQFGTAAGANGSYRISDVPAGEYTVRATFVGYQTSAAEVTVEAGETVTQNFSLATAATELGEVIVTAQGIEQQARELGYAAADLESEELQTGQPSNFVEALQGKVPGLNVTTQSGSVGGSSRVILRGIASLSGNNQPLFVIDGVPISNSQISSGDRLEGTYDTGNQASDISADNIKSVSVLKGGAAAARYGSRAKNGAIIVTTKKGDETEETSVTVSSSLQSRDVYRLPEFQNEYGPGDFGKYDATDLDGWGPRIEGQTVRNFRLNQGPLEAQPDNVSNFYQTGTYAKNNIAVSGGGDFGSFRLGLTRTDDAGVVPESELNKTAVNLGAQADFGNNFNASAGGHFIKEGTLGKQAQGGNDPNVLVPLVNGLPRTVDIETVQNYQVDPGEQVPIGLRVTDGGQVPIGERTNNPYWVANRNRFETEKERFYGFGQIGYTPLEWLTFAGRGGIDFYTEDRIERNAVGTVGAISGAFNTRTVQERQIDFDFTATGNQEIGSDFSIDAIAGFNVNERTLSLDDNDATALTVPGLYRPANAETNVPDFFSQNQRLFGLYGDVTFGFRDYAYLTVTGRNDWSSTLPDENNSYFYPSVNASLILTDVLSQESDFESDILSFAKLFGNYSEVGSDTDPYQLQFEYSPVTSVFGQYGAGLSFPFLGRTGFTGPATIPPSDLKPERQIGYEAGVKLGFFNGRVSLDGTFYNQRTEDQIIAIPVPQSTGFGFRRTNVGTIENQGFELTLSGGLIVTPDFEWRVNANYSQNDNTVTELAPGLDEYTAQSGFNGVQIRAEPGKSLGIYGPDFLRDPQTGKPIIDPETGLRQGGEDKRLSDLYPDFSASFGSTFNAYGFSLEFLIDWQEGGSVYSNTVQTLRGDGLAQETVPNRGGTFIDDGVLVERNAAGEIISRRPNDVPVSTSAFWQRYTNDNIAVAGGIFDASYVKLRSVSLSYELPQSLLGATPIDRASIAVEGRNLALLYSAVPHIDPEVNVFGSGADVGRGYEFNSIPPTRTIGATINLGF
jgi:TonB-linked SusC/RagA family outer membrane protein